MAVTKVKAYHTDNAIDNIIVYVKNEEKATLKEQGWSVVQNAVGYSANKKKTTYIAEDGHSEVLVSGHNCKVDLAAEIFKRTADQYHRNGHNENAGRHYTAKELLRAKLGDDGKPILDADGFMVHDPTAPVYHDENGDTVTFAQERISQARTCYMWVMAFPPESVCGFKIDPHLVEQIGHEFLQELEAYQGHQFPAVVAVHMDREHTHAHIPMSAYSLDGHYKYLDTMETLNKAREISDQLSLKYDLPIIISPENHKSMNHDEWKLAQEGKSWKESIRKEIAYNMERASSYEDFLNRMYRAGYTCRDTEQHITYYTPGKTHRCRDTNLGAEFSKTEIQKYFKSINADISKNTKNTVIQEEIIDPTIINPSKPLRVSVGRYTKNGRRRSDLEILLLKAIKLLKLLGDRFSEKDDMSDNPIWKSANWKIDRLSEAISILDTYGIKTKDDLEKELLKVGAEYSHTKKDYSDLARNYEGLCSIKDMLENLQDLRTIMDSFRIDDFCLIPPTKSEIISNRAQLFPMTPSQRRELYLALQEHPLYKVNTRYDNLTCDEAEACLAYLKGKTTILPAALSTIFEQKSDLEVKYQSIAEKTLNGIMEHCKGKTVTDALIQELSQYDMPVYISSETPLAEAIHLAAYYKPWNPKFTECTDPEQTIPEAKVKQLTELLEFSGLHINIPVEDLSQKDADMLFRDILLSRITPQVLKNELERSWKDNIYHLDYEQRRIITEYRDLIKTVTGLGYDIGRLDESLPQIEAQLSHIREEENKMKTLAQEYKTLKQLKVYTTLAETKQFTYGPKWGEVNRLEVEIKEVEHTEEAEHETEKEYEPVQKRHFNVNTDMDI